MTSLFVSKSADDYFNDKYREFLDATAVEDPRGVDKTNGRVSLKGDDVFYSPNSRQTIRFPLAPQSSELHSLTPVTDNFSDSYCPLWWSLPTAYLAFTPTNPQLSAYPFNALLDKSFQRTGKDSFTNTGKQLRLRRAEWVFSELIHALLTKYKIPGIQPLMKDSAVTFHRHREIHQLKHEFERTRKWFTIHLGVLSYFIASALAMDYTDSTSLAEAFQLFEPPWLSHLLFTQRFEQDFLSGVMVTAGTFDKYSPRVGVFLNILNPPPHQPSVDFFVSFGVPVWYPWGPDEVAAAKTRPEIARLAPLHSQIRGPMSTLSLYRTDPAYSPESPPQFHRPLLDDFPASPTSPLLMDPQNSTIPKGKCDQNAQLDQPWIKMFEKRLGNRPALLASEAEDDRMRQRRLSRMRSPPTGASTTVYEWEYDDEANEFKRALVRKAENSETLDAYLPSQKLYDPFLNVWDCCAAWSRGTVDEHEEKRFQEEEEEEEGFDLPTFVNPDYIHLPLPEKYRQMYAESSTSRHPGQPPPISSSSIDSSSSHTDHRRERSPHTWPLLFDQDSLPQPPAYPLFTDDFRSVGPPVLTQPNDPHPTLSSFPIPLPAPTEGLHPVDEKLDLDYLDAIEFLSRHFGFVTPEPLPQRHPRPRDLGNYPNTIARAIGELQLGSTLVSSTSLLQYVIEFFECMKSKHSPPNNIYDLAVGNRHYVGASPRLKFLRQTGTSHFTFAFPKASGTVVPYLTVRKAADALFVCRLPVGLSDVDICKMLVHQGIAFNTLLPMPIQPRKQHIPIRPPIRFRKHQFTPNDYNSYVMQRQSLFLNQRIRRAALMDGGILWRLVVGEVTLDEIESGPTADTTAQGRGLYLQGPTSDYDFCDDALLPGEAEVLCGVTYRMRDAGQHEELSWWPPPDLFKQLSGFNSWREVHEQWYSQRLGEIKAGSAQPLNQSTWRKTIRASSHVRNFHRENEEISLKILRQMLPSDPSSSSS